MRETALYAAAGRQSLDLFYHIDHIGKESNAVIDVKGLMTRGFSLEDARLIVVEALIRPLIDRLDESVREEVLAEVRRKLDTKEK